MVVGRWMADTDSLHLLKAKVPAAVCEIAFKSDGTFTTSGIPDYLLKTSDHAIGELVAGSGRWELVKKGYFIVVLNFDQLNGAPANFRTTSLLIDNSKKDITLFCWVGEEGSQRFNFRRTP
jgi:hypothetical protein